jgi:hypothetical protein
VWAGGVATLTTTVAAGTLAGAVGVHDANGACQGGVGFVVSQGGSVLFDSGMVAPYTDARAFAVAVAAGDVTLTTTPGGACATGAWLGLTQ